MDEFSDDLFIKFQSDPVSLCYLRKHSFAPLHLMSLGQTTSDWIWWFVRDIGFFLASITKEMPDLSLKVIFKEGHTFSATADIFEGHGIICFDQAVVVMVNNIFQGLLCNDNLLTEGIGSNPHAVKFTLPDGDFRPTLFMRGEVPSFLKGERFGLAVSLSSMCLSFIFLHEFAHIRNGHVDLLKSILPHASIEETTGRIPKGLSALDCKTLEWDADRVAYLLATDFGLSRLLDGVYTKFPPKLRKEAFLKLHVGYYLFFRLMQGLEEASTPYEHRLHPLPADRLSFLAAKAIELADDMGFEVSIEELGETSIIGEEVWKSAFPNPPEISFSYIADDKEIMAMLRNWNALRPRLVPLNRGTTELAKAFENIT